MNLFLILNLLTAIVVSAALLIKLPPVACKIGLVDHPDARKKHKGSVPLVGGIAMFIGFAMAMLTLDIPLHPYRGLFAGAIILIVVGVLDDLHELHSTPRFLAQILAAIAMAEWGGVRLLDLGYIGPGDSLVQLNWWSSLLTVFATLGVINSLNMIDGLDRLAGSITLVTLTSLAYLAYIGGNDHNLMVLLLLNAVVLTFIFFNRHHAPGSKFTRVFMGDAGSMFLGFVLCWFFIKLSQGDSRVMNPVTALWIYAIPLIDTVSQMFRRILQGQSPFKPDCKHVHHLLLSAGLSKPATVFSLMILAAIMASIGIIAQQQEWSQMMMFYIFLACFAAYFMYTWLIDSFIRQPR
jgi:UDP-GlcNAc:undecaprenyl-phosphate GlcNAc-1-phosphate transferase